MMAAASRRSGRSVVVTKAGAGLGRDVALVLAASGYIVFGTAASSAEKRDLRDASGGRVSLTVCDTTNAMFLEAWAGGVADALGDAGLAILINDARILTPGPMEILPLDAIRRDFECNVFSAVAVINAFIPALRKGRGRIVQISSWSPGSPTLFSGLSEASNAALAVFTAAYRTELEAFGVEVVLASVDRGSSSSEARPASLADVGASMTPEQRRLYGKSIDGLSAALAKQAEGGTDTDFAARIIEIAQQRPAPIHAFVGSHAHRILSDELENRGAAAHALSAPPNAPL